MMVMSCVLIACWKDIGENDMTERERLIELLLKGHKKHLYYDQIADYLLANGVIIPPCKVGDVVWLIGNMRLYTKEVICSRKVISIQRLRTGETLMHIKDGCFNAEAIGEYVFFTKEKAEQALKGGAE